MYPCGINELCGTFVYTELDDPGENVAAIEWPVSSGPVSATMIGRFQLRDRLLEDARL